MLKWVICQAKISEVILPNSGTKFMSCGISMVVLGCPGVGNFTYRICQASGDQCFRCWIRGGAGQGYCAREQLSVEEITHEKVRHPGPEDLVLLMPPGPLYIGRESDEKVPFYNASFE